MSSEADFYLFFPFFFSFLSCFCCCCCFVCSCSCYILLLLVVVVVFLLLLLLFWGEGVGGGLPLEKDQTVRLGKCTLFRSVDRTNLQTASLYLVSLALLFRNLTHFLYPSTLWVHLRFESNSVYEGDMTFFLSSQIHLSSVFFTRSLIRTPPRLQR